MGKFTFEWQQQAAIAMFVLSVISLLNIFNQFQVRVIF